ncbi:hypothetical protein GCM10009866_00810 [Cellulomonas aerilata]
MAEVLLREGTWFWVPLPGGKEAMGLISRVSTDGLVAMGFFFGPFDQRGRVDQRPSAEAASLRARFATTKVRAGDWELFEVEQDWHRDEWPVPSFCSREATGTYIVRYDDDDLVTRTQAEVVDDGCGDVPTDGLLGPVAVERVLASYPTGKR